jgi:hypothetical protein
LVLKELLGRFQAVADDLDLFFIYLIFFELSHSGLLLLVQFNRLVVDADGRQHHISQYLECLFLVTLGEQ